MGKTKPATCHHRLRPSEGARRLAYCNAPATPAALVKGASSWSPDLCAPHLAYYTGRAGWRVVVALRVVVP